MFRPPANLYQIFSVALLPLLAISLTAADPAISYERDVRPILKAHCFQCHGEAGVQEGSLDLRLRQLILKGGDSGAAIVPGKPAESYLLERIVSGEMPPEDTHLGDKDIQLISDWIAAGAITLRDEPEDLGSDTYFTEEERSWWSFRPVIRPGLPQLNDPRIQTPIDAFLLRRLREQNPEFGFAEPVDRIRLIRRASLVLTGLPPRPADVAAFQTDDSPLAWTQLLDRLLASPQYGERWGRHWLDAAGYADSEGYTDEDRVREHAYAYRDYVIRSLNSDKPYDQFIMEQLAGDELVAQPVQELTPGVVEKLAATGFLRMAPDGTGSSVDQNLARNQVMADTIEIVSTALLGMTIQCAQCHDHRYDPISQLDYYRFRAIFEPALDWKNWQAPSQRQISLYTAEEQATRNRIEAEAGTVDDERQEKVDFYIARTLHHELLMVSDELRGPLEAAYKAAAGDRSDEQNTLLNDHPNIAKISAGSLYLYDRRRDIRAKDLEQRRDEKQAAMIRQLVEQELSSLPEDQQKLALAALEIDPEKRTDEQKQLLADHPQLVISDQQLADENPQGAAELELYTAAAADIRKYRIRTDLQEFSDRATEVRAAIPTERYIRVLQEIPDSVPETFLFFRGDHAQARQQVEPATLSVLPLESSIPSQDAELPSSGRRLALARQLTDSRHPLVARVMVNRIWMHHFGRGLVASTGDFGVLGERPSHPELLDWLAAEFVESGWSVKQLHRLIMSSTAFQQSGSGNPELHLADQQNQLLGRWPVRRMEGEAIRDSILSASGQINSQLYGEPVPVMEDEVGQIVIGRENLDGERKPTAPIDLKGQQYRRSIYIQVRRSRPLAILELFDGPVMTPNCPQRTDSNVPPQSLLLMNSQVTLAHSTRFAERLLQDHPDSLTDQVDHGWALTIGGAASDDVRAAAIAYVQQQQIDLRKENSELDDQAVELQSLALYCHALFSSSSFIYVE